MNIIPKLHVGQLLAYGKSQALIIAIHIVQKRIAYDFLVPKSPQLWSSADLDALIMNTVEDRESKWNQFTVEEHLLVSDTYTSDDLERLSGSKYGHKLRTDYAFRERMFNILNIIDSMLTDLDIRYGKIIVGQYKDPNHILLKLIGRDCKRLKPELKSIEERTGALISTCAMNPFERFLSHTMEEVWK